MSAQESLLTIFPHYNVIVPVQNFQKYPVELKEGMKLGVIENVCQSPVAVERPEMKVQCAPVRLEESENQRVNGLIETTRMYPDH